MARVFAQHAQAGKYRLEKLYCDPNRWEWFVIEQGQSGPKFSGNATTLKAAKQDAAKTIGLYEANWMDIEPAILDGYRARNRAAELGLCLPHP
jgi:hypothetical protein